MDSYSLVSRRQPKPTHSRPEQKSGFVSISVSLLFVSLVVRLGSASSSFSSFFFHPDSAFVFEYAYFEPFFNKEKLA